MLERTKLRNRILSNPLLRSVAFLLLNAPIIVDNPIYRYVYQRQINRVIRGSTEKPQLLMLEVTNVCNLRCPNCTNKDMKRKRGFMELDIYKKVIDECVALGVNDLWITGGEPTLHPLLVNQVAYAKEKGIESVALITNAQLLTPLLSKRLIKAGLDKLDVSIDAATPEMYSKIRPPGDLKTVEENLETLIKFKREMKTSKPQVTVKFIKEPMNASEVGLFRRKWGKLADEIYISFLHNWGGAISKREPKWRGGSKRVPCSWVFRRMYICWDGNVSFCCLDSEAETLLGDIKEMSIKEIWHSPKLQEIRQAHLNGNFNDIPLCDKCSFRDVWWLY